jgi:CheY-like chemotaxis protein
MTKVLLVEDDNNLREIFDMRLQAEGYKTVTAGDGEEALVVAVKEKPDLVIADVMMPKLSGFEMVENMRAAPELANVKVVMMTALGQAEDRARGEKLGVVKYLVKSQVTLEDFVRIIREVMPPDQAGSASMPNQPDNAAQQPNIIKPQESEASMQDDAQTPTNPTPDAGPAPAGDTSVPAADPAASTNPISDSPAASPLGDVSATTPQSTAEETSAVQDQINNFESDPNAGAAPAVDAGSAPVNADTSSPAADSSVTPAGTPTDVPAPTDTSTPAAPEAPAQEEGNNQPPANNGAL